MDFEYQIAPEEKKELKMSQQQTQNNLVDITDCLEVISVFKGWKNRFFAIAIICLVILQTSFVLVTTNVIASNQTEKITVASSPIAGSTKTITFDTDKKTVAKAASKVVAEIKNDNKSVSVAVADTNTPSVQKIGSKIKFDLNLTNQHIAATMAVVNFVLVLTMVLYCLTLLMSLKVSLVARLGGINHAARAFFWSLIVVVIILPWQNVFGSFVCGVIYLPSDMFAAFEKLGDKNMFGHIIYYARFSGYWLIAMLLLILAHARSAKWSKTILHRLEIL